MLVSRPHRGVCGIRAVAEAFECPSLHLDARRAGGRFGDGRATDPARRPIGNHHPPRRSVRADTREWCGRASARRDFCGQLRSSLVVRPTGRIAVVGARFRADGAPALIGCPQHVLAGLTPDLGDLSASLARQLRDVTAAQPSLLQAARAVGDCLQSHLDESRIDPHVRLAIGAIQRQRGAGSVDDMAVLTGLSRRHLERRFQEVVGLSPKRFARITRFQHALRIFEQGASGQRGAATAAACGLRGSGTLHPRLWRARRLLAGSAPAQKCDAEQALRRTLLQSPEGSQIAGVSGFNRTGCSVRL
jgi:AraC-like DNA-binding protein